MVRDSLGDRMKRYELASRTKLPARMPVIVRVDGRAFHTFCQNASRPFDYRITHAMRKAALSLCSEIQGAQLAYTQSDEISILVHNYKRLESTSWFDNEVQKMASVAASIATATFNAVIATTSFSRPLLHETSQRHATFDARVFVRPESDVCNYFVWRQQDWTRNSLQMLARSLYPHDELDGKNAAEIHEMIFAKGENWAHLETRYKRGTCVYRRSVTQEWCVDEEIPIFKDERDFVERHLQLAAES